MQTCPNCQQANPSEATFCMSCGEKLMRVCVNCGAGLPATARFCMTCGHPVEGSTAVEQQRLAQIAAATPAPLAEKMRAAHLSGERKLVTVLFVDVVGSTALAERMDPEEWTVIMNQAFKHLSPAIHRYEGTIARLMGDALLAFFGAPVAHEDDAVRAISASLELLAAAREFAEEARREHDIQFEVRLGLNTGHVVVGEVGSDLKYEYTAMGDAVNLAARMQSAAEPGAILLTEHTYRLAAPFFQFEDQGMVTVKGRSDPVRTYTVSGKRYTATREGQARGIEGLDSPLVGRQLEIETLTATLNDLRLGGGKIISVMGEAGLGKSRLVAELRRSITMPITVGPELAWLEGRSLSYEKTSPYACFIDLFTRLFDLGSDSKESEKYERIKQELDFLLPDQPDLPGRLAPFLASLLGITPVGEDLELVQYLEPPDLRQRVFQAVGRLVEGLAERRPVVLVFEDLHWVDPTSLDLIESLLPLTARNRLVILALFRPRQEDLSWRFHQLANQDYARDYLPLTLAPLDMDDSRQLVANLLHVEDLPEKVRQLILTKAEGNPFFVEEVIRSLLDAELVVRDNGHWRATRQIADIAVPDTLVGVISARLDRLAPEAKRLSQAASVIGREFQVDVLVEINEAPGNIESSLDILQRRELVREKSRHPYLRYQFKHILTQETAYASMLISQRRAMHHRVAECLERLEQKQSSAEPGSTSADGPSTRDVTAGVIARHFLEAREAARALPYLVRAADDAAHAYSTSEAIQLYTRALEILPDGEATDLAQRSYEGLSGALMLTGDLPAAIENYRGMLAYAERMQDTAMQISALNKLANAVSFLGEMGQAGELLDRAESLARRHQDTPGLAEMFTVRCSVCSFIGDFENAAFYLGEAAELGRKLDHKEQIIHGLTHKANILASLTKFDQAWEAAQEALELAEQTDNLMYISSLRSDSIPLLLVSEGDLEAANRSAAQALEIADRIGHGMSEQASALLMGWIALMRGEYESAIALLKRSEEVGRRLGLPLFEAMPLGMLGSAYLELGEGYQAQVDQSHLRAMELLEYPTGRPAGGMSWDQLGFCVLQKKQFDLARVLFERGLSTATLHRLYNRPRFLTGLAYVELEQGRVGEAMQFVTQAQSDAEEHRLNHLIPEISLAIGRVFAAQGEWQRALDGFEQAERLAAAMGMRPIVWQARLEQSRALTGMSQEVKAAEKGMQAAAVREEMAGLFNNAEMKAAFLQHGV